MQEGRAAVEEISTPPEMYEVKRVLAARRIPKRGEGTTGWEVLIEWADKAHEWNTWEAEECVTGSREVKRMIQEAKEKRKVPNSMLEVIIGEQGIEQWKQAGMKGE